MDHKFCCEFVAPVLLGRALLFICYSAIPAISISRASLTFYKASQNSLLVISLSTLIHYSAALLIYFVIQKQIAHHTCTKTLLIYVYTFFCIYYHFNGGLVVKCIKHMCLVYKIKLDPKVKNFKRGMCLSQVISLPYTLGHNL